MKPLPKLIAAFLWGALVACGDSSPAVTDFADAGNDVGASPDSTTSACKGEVVCASLPNTLCQQAGCAWQPFACEGTAADCRTFSAALCDTAPGCYWNTQFSSCAGLVTACDERGNNCLAGGKSGCSVTGGCSGASRSCAEPTIAGNCTGFPGCVYKPY